MIAFPSIFRGFGGRMVFFYAAVVTVTTAVILGVGRILLQTPIIEGVDLHNRTEFAEIKAILDHQQVSEDLYELTRAIGPHVRRDAALFHFQIYSEDGLSLYTSPNLDGHELPLPEDVTAPRTAEVDTLGPVRFAAFRYGPWNIVIGSPIAAIEQLFRVYEGISLTLLTGVFLGSLLFGHLISRTALQPIGEIAATADRITAQNLADRIPQPRGQDEVSRLVGLLNRMFGRLEHNFRQIEQFTADASHELRTPLQIIRLQAEKLHGDAEERAEATAREWAADILEETAKLNRMVGDLLTLAKTESGLWTPRRAAVALEPFLEDFRHDAEVLAEDGGVTFALQHTGPAQASIDRERIQQVLLNLLSNSLKHMSRGGTITLTSAARERGWQLVMEDEGPGLPPEELDTIFSRFYRTEAGRTKPGVGLGLAICFNLIRAHGGTLRAENRADRRGLRMIIALPLGPENGANG